MRYDKEIKKLFYDIAEEKDLNIIEMEVDKLFDKVLCLGQEGFIFGRRSSGYFDIRKLNGEKIHAGMSYKKIKLLEHSNSMLIAY